MVLRGSALWASCSEAGDLERLGANASGEGTEGMSESKALSEKKHALKRAKQRYDLSLTSREYKELVAKILRGECKSLYKQSNRVNIKSIVYKEQELFLVYDKERHRIVTFLDKEMVDMDLASQAEEAMAAARSRPPMPCKNPTTWEEFKAQTVSL